MYLSTDQLEYCSPVIKSIPDVITFIHFPGKFQGLVLQSLVFVLTLLMLCHLQHCNTHIANKFLVFIQVCHTCYVHYNLILFLILNQEIYICFKQISCPSSNLEDHIFSMSFEMLPLYKDSIEWTIWMKALLLRSFAFLNGSLLKFSNLIIFSWLYQPEINRY